MKTWQFDRFNLEALRIVECPTPQPGPHEVLVRWHAWSLNYRDLVTVEGIYQPHLPLPFIPLSDAAGEVVAVGPAVQAWKPGDRVASHYLLDWEDGPATPEKTRASLGGPLPGLLAEQSVLPERALVALPPSLSFVEGATLPIAAVTAWNALFEFGPTPPGTTVLFEGTGGVSIFGLQLAHAAGLRTIITSGSDEKLARARKLGADETINYRTTPGWAEEARRLTGGNGVDLILDVGGAETLPEAVRALRAGGRIALIGFLSGRAIELNVIELLRSLLHLHTQRPGSRTMFRSLLRTLEQHRIHPVVDREFGFAEVVPAFQHLKAGGHFGKVVIRAE